MTQMVCKHTVRYIERFTATLDTVALQQFTTIILVVCVIVCDVYCLDVIFQITITYYLDIKY